MAIPESFLDELNSRVNIVDVVASYLPLNKKGANYWGLCPFHHEKTPSFSVNESKQIFHCFGCGKGGGPIRFVMEMDSLPFPEAVRKLAQQEGMEVPDDSPGDGAWREKRRRNREAARFYRSMLSDPRGGRWRPTSGTSGASARNFPPGSAWGLRPRAGTASLPP